MVMEVNDKDRANCKLYSREIGVGVWVCVGVWVGVCVCVCV